MDDFVATGFHNALTTMPSKGGFQLTKYIRNWAKG